MLSQTIEMWVWVCVFTLHPIFLKLLVAILSIFLLMTGYSDPLVPTPWPRPMMAAARCDLSFPFAP